MELIWNLIVEYGWQAVVIALLTFLSIECIKPLARKFIKKENARHILYVGCNYLFAIIYSFVLALILKNVANTFTIFAPAMVVINVLGQIISNLGFWNWLEDLIKEAVTKITDKNVWKKCLKELVVEFGVDARIFDGIVEKFESDYENVIPEVKKDPEEFFNNNQNAGTEFVANFKQKLAGFVKSEQLDDAAKKLLEKLVNSWTSKKVEVK